MNLLNEHIFLIISFVVAIVGAYKFAYKRVDKTLTDEIEEISKKIAGADKAKREHEDLINALKNKLNNIQNEQKTAAYHAMADAKKETIIRNETIDKIIKEKREKNERDAMKIECALIAQTQEKYINAVIDETLRKLRELKADSEFQDNAVRNSLEMLRSISEK